MQVCQQCQRENPNEGVFCSYCGSKLAAAPSLLKPANDTPREVLRFLLHRRPECINNLSLLKSNLSDYLVKAEADVFLLCLLAEKRIPERLQSADRISAALFGNLVDTITKQCYLQSEQVREGILIWAYALGKEVEAVLPLSTVVQPKPEPQTKSQLNVSVPQVGQILTIALPKGIALELVWCPPGSFYMGSPKSEVGRFDCEERHRVTLTQGFWIGKYAITQEQYSVVMGNNPSEFKGARFPVEEVLWDEAMSFCNKVVLPADGSIPSGYKLTLPTEAQWEYACRAGTSSAFNDGSNMTEGGWFGIGASHGGLPELGWYIGNNKGREPNKVGLKLPNAWGLYDMHGNILELCLDWLDDYNCADATDPTGPSTGSVRACRGGSWGSTADRCRSAFRFFALPEEHYCLLGFRAVLSRAQ